MKQRTRQGPFLLIQVLNLLVILWSLVIYFSVYEWIPWHEGSGMQLLAIFITSVPAFLILGVASLILGRFVKVPFFNSLIPFIAMAVFVLPIVVGGSDTSVFIGTIAGVAFVPIVLISTTTAYVSMNTEK